MARNPLFDVMFVLQNVEIPRMTIPGLTLKALEIETGISKFDLTLTGIERDDDILFTLEYCVNLFTEETVHRFIDYFKRVMTEILKDTGKKLKEVQIVSPAEKDLLLNDFNNTCVEYPADKTIHLLFEEQAAEAPDRVATVGADEVVDCVQGQDLTAVNDRDSVAQTFRLFHVVGSV